MMVGLHIGIITIATFIFILTDSLVFFSTPELGFSTRMDRGAVE